MTPDFTDIVHVIDETGECIWCDKLVYRTILRNDGTRKLNQVEFHCFACDTDFFLCYACANRPSLTCVQCMEYHELIVMDGM